MSYRDILVQIDNAHGADLRAEAAVHLAKWSEARLTGAFLKSDFLSIYNAAEAFAFMTPADVDALLASHAASVAKASGAARERLATFADKAGVDFTWTDVTSDNDDVFIRYARPFDLTVFPPSARASHGENRLSAASVAMGSGGPVLVLPQGGYRPDFGRRVLIAWKDSRETARAVRDAMPFLTHAEEIIVFSIAEDGEPSASAELDRHLAAHGCKAKHIVEPRDDEEVESMLRRHIGMTGADLVVMGLYGRPRLQELILGGVSRDFLAQPPAPLLVSH